MPGQRQCLWFSKWQPATWQEVGEKASYQMRPGGQSEAQGRRPREDWALQCTGCHSFIGPDAAGLAQGRLGKGLRE